MIGNNFAEHFNELDKGQIYTDIRQTGWYNDAVYEKFSPEEYERRYQATRALMKVRGLDCLIVPGSIHAMSMGHGLVWLTGHIDARTAAHYCVFPMEGDPVLFCSMGGSHVEAIRQAVSVNDVRPTRGNHFGQLMVECIRELGYDQQRIGLMNAMSERFGEEYLPANHYLTLKDELPEAELIFVKEFFHELMYRHSAEEITFIRKAGKLVDDALQAMVDAAKPGVTEYQLAAAATKAIMDGGGLPHLLIISITSMENPNAPFGNPRPSGRALREGDLIMNEIGAWYQGTSAQAGNPIICGKPTPFVQSFWDDVVVPGYRAIEAQLQPGNTWEEIQASTGHVFREKGHQSRPLHIHHIDVATAGPGFGPHFANHQGFDQALQPGMEVMLEPCPITADGKLGMFLGRTFVMTETGKEQITNFPIKLIAVE